jgi:hypothetical protein
MTNKTKPRRTGGMAQAAEYLPCKCKVLSSNPSTVKANKLTNREPLGLGLSSVQNHEPKKILGKSE